MKYGALAAAVAAFSQLSAVAAHGGVLSYLIGGEWVKGFVPYNTAVGQITIQREWDSYNPVQDVTNIMVACNNNGTALPPGQQLTQTVKAGSAVTGYWNVPWPHNTGPVLTYLAECPSTGCDGLNATQAQWFKIQEAGLINGTIYNGTWAAGVLIANNNSWTTTIPATVPSGYYLFRMETIALHSMPAQNYPECAQFQITGGGSLAPDPSILVTFPGGYSQTDPGLDIDIYSGEAEVTYNYTIPGPPLYPGGQGNPTGTYTPPASTATAPPSTGSSSPIQTSSKPVIDTTVSPTSTAPSSTATAAKYGQCGGQGWTGPTVCAAGSTCTYSNAYYSQCL